MIEEDQYVTKDDLDAALRKFGEWITNLLINEMSTRFGEVNQHLARIDATLVNHGKQVGASVRVLGGLSELNTRVQKLEAEKE